MDDSDDDDADDDDDESEDWDLEVHCVSRRSLCLSRPEYIATLFCAMSKDGKSC